mgnify:CR=1 FL=1
MLAIGCAIAVKTKKVRIGTSVLLLPLHDPVRVAEDAATLDVISGGRLELGLGVGYKVEELKAWGIEPKSRGRRMEEGIEIIQRLVDKISIQKGIKIEVEYIKEANHMFTHHDQELMNSIKKYLNNVLDPSEYSEF